jgi:hypothetical protein
LKHSLLFSPTSCFFEKQGECFVTAKDWAAE